MKSHRRAVATVRARLFGVIGVCGFALVAFCGISAPSALAGQTHVFEKNFGTFAGPIGVAVDQTSHDVYVADSEGSAVYKFDAEGNPVGGWELHGQPEGPFNPYGLAVDQATGDLWVASSGNATVQKYDSEGEYLLTVTGGEVPEGNFSPWGLATDSAGNLYVADNSRSAIEKFDSTGKYLTELGFETINGTESLYATDGVAVDSSGNVYATRNFNEVLELSATGECLNGCAPIDSEGARAVGIDPETGHVYTADGGHIAEYPASFAETNKPIDRFGSGELSYTIGVAVDGESGKVYASDIYGPEAEKKAAIFGPLVEVEPPSVELESPSLVNAATESFYFAGHVNPQGYLAKWRIEYEIQGSGQPQLAGQGKLGPGTSPQLVEAEVEGLEANTPYTVTLHAENAGGERSVSRTFKTPAAAPSVAIGTNTPDPQNGQHEVLLRAYVNPRNSSVSDCHVDYGLTSSYGQSAPCQGDPGAGHEPAEVTAALAGLQPGSTYHFRFVVANAAGSFTSEDSIFETFKAETEEACPNENRREEQHSSYLPDCRAYEQVSPQEKNGGDVIANSQRTQVATDGSAASFASLSAFGDAIGTSVAVEYLSLRGAAGWSTHAITPQQPSTTLVDTIEGLQPTYQGTMSPDLSHGVFLAIHPLTADPSVANVVNIYLREDLRSAGSGSYLLLSSCPLCDATGTPLPPLPPYGGPALVSDGIKPWFVGASTDFQHILFESQQQLITALPSENCSLFRPRRCPGKLYESDHGNLRLVGLVPPSPETEAECEGPACVPAAAGSQAGQGGGSFQGLTMLTPDVISANGERAFFTVPSNAGSQAGALYLREDANRTVQLNVSEREGAVDVPSGEPATYWSASADGSRAFFTSNAALTDNASPTNQPTGGNLYMYEVEAPAGHHLTLINADHELADPGEFVSAQGVSKDGHYIYFAAAGQLIAGQPVLGTRRGMYVWHDGLIRYIASLEAADLNNGDTNSGDWYLERPTARVAPDGRHILFSTSYSGEGPTGYDQNGSCLRIAQGQAGSGCQEFYLYNAATRRLSCVTCNPTGEPPRASAFTSIRANGGGSITSWYQNHPLSDNGRLVFFTTSEPLVPGDTNGSDDAYVYNSDSGAVQLVSSGTDSGDSYFMNTDANGANALFLTRQRLTGTDGDDAYDLYDARIGGGFPEPPAPPAPCAGTESCRGAPSPPPAPPNSASDTAAGPGNRIAIRCRHRTRRRHGRCLRHHRSRKHRRANPDRRASR